jgi:hypothetical protein
LSILLNRPRNSSFLRVIITPAQYPSTILKVADIRIFLDYMSCMAGVLQEAEYTHPLSAPGFSPVFSSPDPKQESYCHHWASVVRPLTFHILINSYEATGPIWTKLWWNGSWMAPFQNCVQWSRFPTKMAANLKIEKRGDEILIVHCCFSISQNELTF